MHDIRVELLARAVAAVVIYAIGWAGHGIGDHWIQTSRQSCKKALGNGETPPVAMWHCAKHVATWTAVVAVFALAACWWLHLPVRPGWFAVGMAVNAVTHFVADLRTPLIWFGRLVGKGAYIDHANVMRKTGIETTGPGTATMELDQSWHRGWHAVAALVCVGPL